ncbi:hypothetical protein KKB71_01415 [Patescibacteria group bacterium]|nr:hypothetical protein [Patescibacteria group bacterium]
MCSLNKCRGTRRVQCMKCKGYFDLCPKSYYRDSICPHCGEYFVGFARGHDLGLIKEVPWWYGKKIHSWIEVEWGESYAVIPEFYLDVHMHLAAEKGSPITKEEAIMYFENHAREYWRRKIWIVDNAIWDQIRSTSLYIL